MSLQKERQTALMLAAKNGVFSIVKLLLKFNADTTIQDSVSQSSVIQVILLYIAYLLATTEQ